MAQMPVWLSDDTILRAVQMEGGGRTHAIARRCEIPARRAYMLRRLRRLEALGRVRRHPEYSAENCAYWVRA
jgi:hypothetical protein